MKHLFGLLFLGITTITLAQENTESDSTKVEKLNEIVLTAIRVKENAPITHSNVKKEVLEKRNLIIR